MDKKKQYIILAAVLFTVLLAMAIAAKLGQQRGAVTRTGGGLRFRARPSSAPRKRPILLLVREDDASGSEQVETGGAPPSDIEQGQAAVMSAPPEQTAADEAVSEAVNALSVSEGIASLEKRLGEFEGTEDESRLHCTVARLYSEKEPPDVPAAEEALRKAFESARTPKDRQHAAHVEVTVLVRSGRSGKAIERIGETLAADEPITLPGLQLAVMRGTLYEESGKPEEAETAYRNAADLALEAAKTLGAPARDVYRQACIKLARYYRKSGQDVKAEDVSRELQLNLEKP